MNKEPAYNACDTHANLRPFVRMFTIHKVISDLPCSIMSDGQDLHGELDTANPWLSVPKYFVL